MKSLTCDKCGKTVEDRTGNMIEVMFRENQSDPNYHNVVDGQLKHLCKDCCDVIIGMLEFNTELERRQ